MNDEVEEVSDEGDFLLADKHEFFYKLTVWLLMGDDQAFLNSPK